MVKKNHEIVPAARSIMLFNARTTRWFIYGGNCFVCLFFVWEIILRVECEMVCPINYGTDIYGRCSSWGIMEKRTITVAYY